MVKKLKILSHAVSSDKATKEAIAPLVKRCDELKKQGIEKGSVQRHGKSSYRLAWWEGGKVRTRTIGRSEVGECRAAHERWKEWKRLQKLIKILEAKL